MRPQILAIGFASALVTAAAFVACGGTSGTGSTNPLASREPAGSSYESPNGGEEPAQSTDEPPGTTNGGTNGSLPLCMNPPAGLATCEACIGTSCGDVLSPAIASCSAFLMCVRNCACSDDTCLGNCVGTITSACDTAGTPLGQCIQDECSAQCADIPIDLGGDAGTTTSSPGTGTGTGPTTSACATLAGCCTALPSAEGQACEATAGSNITSACQSELSGLQAENICN